MKKLLFTMTLLFHFLFAESTAFTIGHTFPSLSLSDQFENTQTIDAKTKAILFSFEMDTNKAMVAFMKEKPKGFLETKGVKYISDISGMPSLITSLFALPKMQKYPFSIMLIDDDRAKNYNKAEGKFTYVKLNNMKIKSIEFISPQDLGKILK
jgi:hypothetical protein